ncbi:MAG: DUF116 domain-containing protein [Anaerolineae bacterium]
MDDARASLGDTEPSRRVLLLSHCMRPSQTCPGRFNKLGLACPDDCTLDCAIGRLRRLALDLGYQGVCVAAGGKMALRYVQESNPLGIVAVACHKELAEGVDGVRSLRSEEAAHPFVVGVALLRDGCVDTCVDEAEARETIAIGCVLGLTSLDPAHAQEA